MSSQKVLMAFCLVAGFVAVAQAQLNFQQCATKMQSVFSDYQKDFRSAIENLIQALQQRGGQAVDVSQYQSDMETIVNEMQSLTNFEGGIDSQRLMQSWFKIIQTQSSMVLKGAQASMVSGAFTDYTTFTTTMMRANAQFFSKATAECSPRAG